MYHQLASNMFTLSNPFLRRILMQRPIRNNSNSTGSTGKVLVSKSTATTAITDLDKDSTRHLVERLLTETRQLMDSENDSSSINSSITARMKTHHVVAFSGGVDSSLVLQLLVMVAATRPTSTADTIIQPILGVSPAVSQEQLEQAHTVAAHIGVDLLTVPTQEGSDATYIENTGQACFVCKTHLYSSLNAIMNHITNLENNNDNNSSSSTTTTTRRLLYNGTNADDTKDPTRVGLLAARNFSVHSPLIHSTKQQVRLAAQYLGLPNYNTAASPCLRSRLALGVPATVVHLTMLQQAERQVRMDLNLSHQVNMRVRMLHQGRARIELDAMLLDLAIPWMEVWTQQFTTLGFSSVSLGPFQTGSVSTMKHVPAQGTVM